METYIIKYEALDKTLSVLQRNNWQTTVYDKLEGGYPVILASHPTGKKIALISLSVEAELRQLKDHIKDIFSELGSNLRDSKKYVSYFDQSDGKLREHKLVLKEVE